MNSDPIYSFRRQTWLCIATELSLPTQWVKTEKVQQWKKSKPPAIDKRPTVFVLRGFQS